MTALQNREEDLAQRLLNGEVRALSRTLTLVENQTELGAALHRRLYANTGKAHIIGITGSPGAGKSSLVNEIALTLIKAGNKVAILAVDPSSVTTGPLCGAMSRFLRCRRQVALGFRQFLGK